MPENKIIKNQAGVGQGNDASDREQDVNLGVTRREFLQKSMMVTSGLALSAMLPAFTPEDWGVVAQTVTCKTNQPLQKIMEITAKPSVPGGPGTLKAVIKILNEKKEYLAASAASSNPVCNSGQMR